MRSALTAIIVALVGFSTASKAYVLEGKSWPSGTVLVLQLGLGSAGRTLQDGNTSWDDAVFPVAAMWNQTIGRVQVANVLNPLAPVSSSDRVNSVVFTTSIFGQAFGANTLAVTYYSSSGSNMIESDTLFNRAATFDSYRGPLQFVAHGPAIADIRRVFLHELGHSLGLGHPDQGGQQVVAVMNSIVSNQEVLSSDDIAGGQFLYGAPVALPTPTPTPVPTPTPTPNPTPTPGTPASHLANISTRMKVGVGQNVLIGGFIIQGTQAKQLIMRAIGPSLAANGITGAISDPTLELHNSAGGVVASNDDWQDGPQASQIQNLGFAPGSRAESAMMVTLSPGSYTAIVSGYNSAQGIGLIEAYEMDGTSSRLVNISTRGRVWNRRSGSNDRRLDCPGRVREKSYRPRSRTLDGGFDLRDFEGSNPGVARRVGHFVGRERRLEQQPAGIRDRQHDPASQRAGIGDHRHAGAGKLHGRGARRR